MKVEVWSDVICPWCYVGKRRLESALRRFEHRDEVKLVWRSFELDPAAPRHREGSAAEHLASKYGMSSEQVAASPLISRASRSSVLARIPFLDRAGRTLGRFL